eukprot:jgi/Chlat1/300/Chrsp1S03064
MAGMESLSGLEASLKATLKKEAEDAEKRYKALEVERQQWAKEAQRAREQVQAVSMPAGSHLVSKGASKHDRDDQARLKTLDSLKDKEAEIEKRKTEVRGKVQAKLARVEEQARRLEELHKELDLLEDPTKKEVAEIRRRIELVDRELRPLKTLCERKEKELKTALEQYNQKSELKTELVGKLMEVVTESERLRLQKLDELNKHLRELELS